MKSEKCVNMCFLTTLYTKTSKMRVRGHQFRGKVMFFSDLKSFPDLGMIFRSILDRFGSHFGSILVMKTMSKIDAKNNSGQLRKITNFGAKMASPPSPKNHPNFTMSFTDPTGLVLCIKQSFIWNATPIS